MRRAENPIRWWVPLVYSYGGNLFGVFRNSIYVCRVIRGVAAAPPNINNRNGEPPDKAKDKARIMKTEGVDQRRNRQTQEHLPPPRISLVALSYLPPLR